MGIQTERVKAILFDIDGTLSDSDDLMVPDALERMVSAVAGEDEKSVVYGAYLRIDEDGNIDERETARLRKDMADEKK